MAAERFTLKGECGAKVIKVMDIDTYKLDRYLWKIQSTFVTILSQTGLHGCGR